MGFLCFIFTPKTPSTVMNTSLFSIMGLLSRRRSITLKSKVSLRMLVTLSAFCINNLLTVAGAIKKYAALSKLMTTSFRFRALFRLALNANRKMVRTTNNKNFDMSKYFLIVFWYGLACEVILFLHFPLLLQYFLLPAAQ